MMGKEFCSLQGKLIPATWGSVKMPVNASFEDTFILASPSIHLKTKGLRSLRVANPDRLVMILAEFGGDEGICWEHLTNHVSHFSTENALDLCEQHVLLIE